MDYAAVCLVSVFAAGLTLFSGFGLGTVLMPAFALFFPVPLAIAATAVVHLANNFFKLALVGRHADPVVLLRFGLPAVVAALPGAWLLTRVASASPLATYDLGGQPHEVTLVKLVIGALLVAFAVTEVQPRFQALAFDRKHLVTGGVLSGFFGGLSGHQGALRSAFLFKAGLSKESFIGTGVAAAALVDLTRIAVYGAGRISSQLNDLGQQGWGLVAAACVAAFVGSYAGSRLIRKITLRGVQIVAGVMLIAIGAALATGLV